MCRTQRTSRLILRQSARIVIKSSRFTIFGRRNSLSTTQLVSDPFLKKSLQTKQNTTDGSSGQVLQTNGSGTLSFVDQSGGGEGGSSFPNCTVTQLPGSEGNFDLAKQFDQTGSAETPFVYGATAAFGVSLGQIYTMMDPVGSTLSPTDLGVLS